MESDDELRTIGEMARATGLTVSALRFYDGAGVLVPAFVDPRNGYRRYAAGQLPAARLVAGLRRVGMPLTGITAMLDRLDDRPALHALLDAHQRRLEDGLTSARRELSRIHRLIDGDPLPPGGAMTTLTMSAGALREAIAAVRYAAGTDPELPVLGGVFVEILDGALRLVTTDRYRMAIADVPVRDLAGPDVGVVAPLPLVDALVPLLAADAPVRLSVDAGTIAVSAGGHELTGVPVPGEFPDYRRALAAIGGHQPVRATVDAVALREAASHAPTVRREDAEVMVLTSGPDGSIEVGVPDGPHRVAVNREFLLAALDAGGPGQLVLELDGPIMPLALRGTDSFAVLMPVRL